MAASTKIAKLLQHSESACYQNIANLNKIIRLCLNDCFTAVGAARGTTAAKAKTVNTATYTIDGVFKTKAGTDDFWTFSGVTVAVSSWQKYLLLIDASGTASILAGTQSTVSAAAVVLPAPPDAKCILAVLTIATDGSTTFVPGTTALNAAGITATFVDGIDAGLIPNLVDGLTNATIL